MPYIGSRPVTGGLNDGATRSASRPRHLSLLDLSSSSAQIVRAQEHIDAIRVGWWQPSWA